jgi:hypothetical protein
MKSRRRKTKAGTPAALPNPPQAPASQQKQVDGNRLTVGLPPDPAKQRQTVKDTYINVIGASVFAVQNRYITDVQGTAARTFMAAMCESVQPRDAVEEMLLVQMVWTHARLGNLTVLANQQTTASNVRIVHDACDKAANTFRRMMLALADYRRPPQVAGFVAVRQANIANQQVVQNVENQNQNSDFRKPLTSNEQGSAAPALSPIGDRIDGPAGSGAAKQAMAAQHRPADGGRKDQVQSERYQTRGA